ncbi:L-mandelate dehydrogenase [Calocera viscosa TUFC12733]|uniref:L-lactate dehydrogenase (cytochrome) n=1 Tax=Calocera viscosa (strain TUFC12733) TaxID=1330018 RepID=A0A167H8W2_CALVF|nr:L-mandelate dehydrogenase [Calocera viscosa TUFC12733]
MPGAGRTIPFNEVQLHNTRDDCWVVIDGEVYDVTHFLADHPGGTASILRMAGKDATDVFTPIHPPGTLTLLPPTLHMGSIDLSTLPLPELSEKRKLDLARIDLARRALPPPEAAVNLGDIERLAQTVLTSTAWAYYSSAADDEISHRENLASFKRFFFRPRVLNKVSSISMSTTLFNGVQSTMPVYVSPAAMARLGHPDGEMEITRACAKEGVVQGVSANSSCSLEEIMDAKTTGQDLIYQLYMNRNRQRSREVIEKVDRMGFKGIMLTVDAPVSGKRERDIRAQGDDFQGPAEGTNEGKGVAQAISGYQDPDVNWADIAWIKSLTKLPLYIKGIQCVEDAEKAYEHGVAGIIISNHGGRQLDYAPASMTVLYELSQRRPDLMKQMDVYLDGGIRRGTDVLKALCLGAKGVGIGRPVLYGNGCWGEQGVRRVFQIMREEIATGMRLLGVTRLEDLRPEMIRYTDRDPTLVCPGEGQ